MGPYAALSIFILTFPKVRRRDADSSPGEGRNLGTMLKIQAAKETKLDFLQLSCFVIIGGKCLLCTHQNCAPHIAVLCSVHFQIALSEWEDKHINKICIFINIACFLF